MLAWGCADAKKSGGSEATPRPTVSAGGAGAAIVPGAVVAKDGAADGGVAADGATAEAPRNFPHSMQNLPLPGGWLHCGQSRSLAAAGVPGADVAGLERAPMGKAASDRALPDIMPARIGLEILALAGTCCPLPPGTPSGEEGSPGNPPGKEGSPPGAESGESGERPATLCRRCSLAISSMPLRSHMKGLVSPNSGSPAGER